MGTLARALQPHALVNTAIIPDLRAATLAVPRQLIVVAHATHS
jgi:hypothetical protein